ncbi:MAG: ABC transporter substrate-binding protein [Betaproteobacteria bacterium]|nr:ABC transporter substrate-binding protein [Betaproteobacteria bacterium]
MLERTEMLRARMLGACLLLWASALNAQSITIGLGADVTSIDPHFHLLTPNANVAEHVFETLISKDERQRMKPGFALSWTPIDATTWEFKLRPGVKFHDGSPFSAEDVVFSMERPASIKNSPGPYTIYTRGIAGMTIVDPLTLRIKTATAYPLLAVEMGAIAIVSKKQAAGAGPEDFNSGKATIGTGPFRFLRWSKGDRIELVRNSDYWGGAVPWEKVTLRVVPNDPARVASLLAGDVQAIENVPTADYAKIAANVNLTTHRIVSNRLIYLHVDSNRDKTPFVTEKAGKPLDRNPLKDVRVRQAISKAINRPVLAERLMEGLAIPTGQLMPEGFFGHDPSIKAEAFDADGARKLLAQAGYPDGFRLTIHGPNDRYVNDEQICQALAQMLSRIGIATKVETMPASVYFSRANKLEFSLMLVGWGSDTGEASSPLKALLATFDRDKGMGTANRGRYSSGPMDRALAEALRTVDDPKREHLLQEATAIAMRELGIIPIHHQVNVWATRKGFSYLPRTDERTYAIGFRM